MGFDLSKIAEWINLKPRFWFGVLLLSSFLLFLPSESLDRLGLEDFRNSQKSWISLVFLGSIAFLGSYAAEEVWITGKKTYLERRQLRSRQDQIANLSPSEKNVLREYIGSQEATRCFEISDGIVNGLVVKGILYCSSNISVHYTSFPFNLQPWAWKYLNKHPEILSDSLSVSQTNTLQQRTNENC